MDKKANILTIIIFVGIIAFLSVAFIIDKDESFSEQENRDLQTFPELKTQEILDGSFSGKINSYFADQFPFRDFFVAVKGYSELAMLKNENNGVLLGEDGYLAVRNFPVYNGKEYKDPTDYFSEKVLSVHFSSVKKLQETLDKQNTEFVVMIPPRTIDVASEKFDYPAENSEKLQNYIREGLKDVNYIDILPMLKEKLDDGEYVYYKTDHHYTTLGAYYAYTEVMKQFGMGDKIIPISDFEIELASSSFYGTTWSKAGFKFVEPDSMFFYHYKYIDEEDFTTVKDGEAFKGFYDRSKLDTKDKYSAFIGGNSYRTSISKTSGNEKRPKLLLAKDSFGLCLAPFLALHFNLEIVNIADMHSLSKLASDNECDYVLIVYNTENIISSKYLAYVS